MAVYDIYDQNGVMYNPVKRLEDLLNKGVLKNSLARIAVILILNSKTYAEDNSMVEMICSEAEDLCIIAESLQKGEELI